MEGEGGLLGIKFAKFKEKTNFLKPCHCFVPRNDIFNKKHLSKPLFVRRLIKAVLQYTRKNLIVWRFKYSIVAARDLVNIYTF